MANDLTWFKFRFSWIGVFKTLSKPEMDRLFEAIEAFINGEECPDMVGRESVAWILMKHELEDDVKARNKAAEAHRKAGENGGRPKTKMVSEFSDENQNNQIGDIKEIRNKEIRNKEIRDKDKDKEEEKSIKRASKKSENKKVYGSHQNVLLTDDEYRKLCERFPDADGKIEALSLGIASKGYKYKDHYATILNWARMDAEKTPQSKPPETTFGDIRGFFEASEPEWDIEI